MTKLEVVTVYPSNRRDVVATLRAIADEVEAGKFGTVDQVALVLHGETVEVFGIGDTSGSGVHLLLACGQRKLENGVLFP